jgi:hypothetical protein
MPSAETGGVDPQGTRIADVGGRQIGQRPVRGDLSGGGARNARERGDEGEDDRPARRSYGRTSTVERSTCVTGIARPWAGSVTVRLVESCDSPPRNRPSSAINARAVVVPEPAT